ncbi:hypothetical protein HHK36_026217 [Tetracentron sinense]|uniref:F-box domain-containing protein n=1 Tax=Tetracentron sinense TaxID=13715 RepID=A0A835D6B6_TETSI|nr:hypothetical protein HHK36_026217 [Tetracentron sinense]
MGQGTSSSYHYPKHRGGKGSRKKGHRRGASSSDEEDVEDDLTLGMPDECLSWVFGKLGCQDRNACSLVCRRWKLVDSRSRQRLVLVARSELSPLLPPLLSRFNSVSLLSLKCSRKLLSIDDHALARIPTLLTSLKKLKLKGCVHISDDGLHAFSLHRPRLLTKLSFASCSFGATGLNSLLSNCPSLQDLTLKRLRKLDAQNTPLSLFLDHDNDHNNNNNNKKQLQLERLCLKDLHNARLFTPLLLCSSKSLKTLVVCRSSGNWDRVLESLLFQQGQGQGLGQGQGQGLGLAEIQMENVQLGDAGLVAISATCPDLEVLYLSRASDCTDAGLSAVANSCRKLRKLHIDACSKFGIRSVGDDGVLSLATRCAQLQEVVLMGVPLTVLSLNALASNCPSLERMALCNTDSVGDAELGFIAAKFSALKKLCIKNCPISDAGVESVGEGCPNLVKLKIKRCRGVTQESVCQWRVQRRSLVVSVDAGSLTFEEEQMMAAAAVPRPSRRASSSNTTTTTTPTTTRTHVVCSSRGASLLGSKLGNALQLRRPNNALTSHAAPAPR